ncbi:uncharacterized protein LOC62_05G007431 [Vanrija pseudolonga]|uniref:Uncharacterized protein n=1 Tax=Vanrija pseudolonga TaxID=143232 RepID=A0AAF0YBW4_9TREE|nr:hypothetical protein LOC62_05G007431 [Vanrija pseudolonga]
MASFITTLLKGKTPARPSAPTISSAASDGRDPHSPANRSPTNGIPANHPPVLYGPGPPNSNPYAPGGGWPAALRISPKELFRNPTHALRSPEPVDSPNPADGHDDLFDEEWHNQLMDRINSILGYHATSSTLRNIGHDFHANEAIYSSDYEVTKVADLLVEKIGHHSAHKIEKLILYARHWPLKRIVRLAPVPNTEAEHPDWARDRESPTRGRSRAVRHAPYTVSSNAVSHTDIQVPPARRPKLNLPEPISPLANRRTHECDHPPSRLAERRLATRAAREPTPRRITIPGYMNGGTGNSRPASRDPTPAASRVMPGPSDASSSTRQDLGGGSSSRPSKRKYDDGSEDEDDASERAVRDYPVANRPHQNAMPSGARVVETFSAAVSAATLRDREIKAKQERFAAEAEIAREAAMQSRIADRLPKRACGVKRERSSSAASSPTLPSSSRAASPPRIPLVDEDEVVVKTEPIFPVVKSEPVSPVVKVGPASLAERVASNPLNRSQAKRGRKSRGAEASEARATPTRTLPRREGRGQRRPTPIDEMYVSY